MESRSSEARRETRESRADMSKLNKEPEEELRVLVDLLDAAGLAEREAIARSRDAEWDGCEARLGGRLQLLEVGSVSDLEEASDSREERGFRLIESGAQPRSSFEGFRPVWIAAAAVVLLASIGWKFGSRDSAPGLDPNAVMGASVSEQSAFPQGEVDHLTPFTWPQLQPLPPGGHYRIVVVDPAAPVGTAPLASSPALQEARWDLPLASTIDWPREIKWTVRTFGASSADLLDIAEHEATLVDR